MKKVLIIVFIALLTSCTAGGGNVGSGYVIKYFAKIGLVATATKNPQEAGAVLINNCSSNECLKATAEALALMGRDKANSMVFYNPTHGAIGDALEKLVYPSTKEKFVFFKLTKY